MNNLEGGGPMKNCKDVSVIGIDLAKEIFSIYATDKFGNKVFKGRMNRVTLMRWLVNIPVSIVGMEACGGANYFAREIKKMGHTVRLMAPNHVTPYITGNKDDDRDAEAISEAVTRPRMKFVEPKTLNEQQIQAWHRIRSSMIRERTKITNEMRAIAYEFGFVIPKGFSAFYQKMGEVFAGKHEDMVGLIREDLHLMWKHLEKIEENISYYDAKIHRLYTTNETCQRLGKVPGVGKITATAIMGLGDLKRFGSSRDFAAWLGLIPRHTGTGGKVQMLGISKRGDRYLRYLLVHGGRAVVSNAHGKKDACSLWITRLKDRAGINKASVAMAHKNARIIWSMVTRGDIYRAEKAGGALSTGMR
jgi:transposase